MSKKIGIIVGSLRRGSYNKIVAKYVASLLPDGYEPYFIHIGNLPLYNEDLEDDVPPEWQSYREIVASMDAFLFFSPEYNRSFPAAMKNAIDVASRPKKQNKWSKKPVGIITVSTGSIGGFGANQHLRQVLSTINMYPMQQPEAFVKNIESSLDESGNLVSESLQTFLAKFVRSYIRWIEHFLVD